MATRFSMQRRLRMNRPSLRRNAKPPKLRSLQGTAFTAANLAGELSMQQCQQCETVNYPPREVCQQCLSDQLVWREVSGAGRLINRAQLHHSQWEFFKRRMRSAPWAIASVKLDVGPVVFAHLALSTFSKPAIDAVAPDAAVRVFSHTDAGRQSVLIAVSADAEIASATARKAITEQLGLLDPAVR